MLKAGSGTAFTVLIDGTNAEIANFGRIVDARSGSACLEFRVHDMKIIPARLF